jgi:hypothetical protein
MYKNVPLIAFKKDFSLKLNPAPALKGDVNKVPLGNKKGDFKVNLRSRKNLFGCYSY